MRIKVTNPIDDTAASYGEAAPIGWFDTDKADRWDGRTEWDGHNMADVHCGATRWQSLYRTAGGRWVLNQRSAWTTERESHEFVEPDAAREWLLLNEDDDAVEKYWGPLPEESGPDLGGRPAIDGSPVNIKFTHGQLARLDAAVAEMRSGDGGKASRADVLRALVDAAYPEPVDGRTP